MALIDIFGENKVDIAIQRLKAFDPEEGYYLAFSGGKDSVTIKALADMAGVKYDAHYSLTTVDPPELVHFIQREHKDVKIEHPETTMWKLIVKNGMPPTRLMRYCCRILKETGGSGRRVVTGIRQQESYKRSNRRLVEQGFNDKSITYVNPIIDWSDKDVWEFINGNGIPYCSLYDEGWKRLGCVCCPNGNQQKQAERWPKIADGYRRACVRAFDVRKAKGLPTSWDSGEEMFEWWLGINGAYGTGRCDDDQLVMFE